ncbi:dipeptide ABC transporter ATP-binding protein [Amorphus orientalis]|uniref:Peptide/nickel transport system ATP-binding protein n=1 Tax=Amorphus orientalis TaxID=649198 RepID=A0AAE3VK63_9HYPH|nr:ABC transporter ATP-binding protein [Amorphus orientalis]MDQ0313854.1 peptide/nickel transport system ATP-binding protein [Amorphus orientalis]
MDMLVARNVAVSADLPIGTVPVIRELDFSLPPGRVLGLVGESGAGKSMIGRTIAKLLPPRFGIAGGELMFDGQDLVRMPGHARRALLGREIAFIPQEPLSGLNPVLTIGQQFDEHLKRIAGGSARARRDRAIAMLDAVHLTTPAELLHKYPHQLSGGMCQRVLIAMAFASGPKLLVADEPTTALDVTIQARVVNLIREMKDRDGTAVVFITHDLQLAAQICDDIMVLYAGRPVEYGPATDVFSAPGHPYTRCLQLSNPAMSGPRRGLYTLPERMPGLSVLNELTGCPFASRCPNVVEACQDGLPPFVSVGGNRTVACIRSESTAGIAPPPPATAEAPDLGTPLLTATGLSKTFTVSRGLFRKTAVDAVKEISFELHQNEFVGIVGESGSGKSTVARMLCGLEAPSAGSLVVAGREVGDGSTAAKAHQRAHVQMVFQDPQSALNPRRKVGSIVTQAMEAAGERDWSARLARAETLLSEIGLPPEAATRYPTQLSGGQKQRVNIARALCVAPNILVADEIVSGLDVSVQAQLLNLLLQLRRERGFSMILISHDLSVVRYLCDRVLVMYRGEVVEAGRTGEVFDAPSHPYTKMLLAAVPPDDPTAPWTPFADATEAGAGTAEVAAHG